MSPTESGIEFTAHCPALLPQYKGTRVTVEIDGQSHQMEWDRPSLLVLPPGSHQVRASIRGLLMSTGLRSLDVITEADQITEVYYTLTMLSLVNPGKLTVKGKRPASSVTS